MSKLDRQKAEIINKFRKCKELELYLLKDKLVSSRKYDVAMVLEEYENECRFRRALRALEKLNTL